MINLNDFRKNLFHKVGIRECPHYSEDGVILKIFEKIGVSSNPLIIEFGETRSLGTTTRSFRIKYFSKAIYFTGNLNMKSTFLNILDIFKITFSKRKLRYLKFLFNLPFKYFVTPDNIINLLQKKNVNNIDILTIDIDSYDYYITKKILEEGFKPTLLILEYNPSIPIDLKITYPYKTQKNKPVNKKVYGASFKALHDLAKKYDYELIHISGFCNLFFVNNQNSKNFIQPILEAEIPKNNNDILNFIDIYCQKNFVPSWLYEPELSASDLEYFDKV